MKYELKKGRISIDTGSEFEGKTVQEFLEYFRQSKKNRYLLILNKNILINREPVSNDQTVLQKNDIVTILLPALKTDFKPSETPCRVVYEDDFVYVAHKDAGIIIHDENDPDCLACRAAAWQTANGVDTPVRYIHRLDKETSGLVLFVKIPFFQPWYDAMLEEKQIRRHYLAITLGSGEPGRKFTYNQKIGKDRHVSGKYRFSESGKEAVTRAEFLARKNRYMLIGCTLETGRTHQIRVHLSGNRHPIINDPLYGIPSADFRNMCLWADEIEFPNPVTHEVCTAKDTMNPDFRMFFR